MNKEEQYLSIGKVAKILGVAVVTLRRWEKNGKLNAKFRTFGNHRRYFKHDVTKLLDAHFWDNVVDCFVPKIWNGGDDMAFSFLLDDQMNYLIGNHNDEDKVD